MIKITVIEKGKKSIIETPPGRSLFEILRDSGIDIYAPCGGNGKCGKCRVNVRDEGTVTACSFRVTKDIEILLPGERELKILDAQNNYTKDFTFDPGPAANLSENATGIAIDIGTTSLVFYLVDLRNGRLTGTRSMLNPQSKYGGDVISRIHYCQKHTDGVERLQSEIIQAINAQLRHFISGKNISANDIVRITAAGNATMLHLLLGIDPTSIALAPFTPAFTGEKKLTGKELKLHCHQDAEIKILPSIASYVGADIVAGLASLQMDGDTDHALYLDIGTNGELALITRGKILCCATAAGPAFEGATISCGMGAVEGAISSFESGHYATIGELPPLGICGSGLIDIVAWLVNTGIVDGAGLLENDFKVAGTELTGTGSTLFITQQDIREVQLAKAAIAAGLRILVKEAGLTFRDVDRLYLAGGFGNYINTDNAITIGLLPAELRGKAISIGNAAGTGTMIALKSVGFDQHIDQVVKMAEYIELSFRDDFNMEFAMQMNF
jgi:uncharacterized 2Fe-2S/4Fe-4S cluster protein (DUF4445 family)